MQFHLEGRQALSPTFQTNSGGTAVRTVGQLKVTTANQIACVLTVSRFHFDGHSVRYKLGADAANGPWLPHDDSMEYVPYAFTVMDSLTRLPECWDQHMIAASGTWCRVRGDDGVSLNVVDSRVLEDQSLWLEVSSDQRLEVMVAGETGQWHVRGGPGVVRGWIPATGLHDSVSEAAAPTVVANGRRVAGNWSSCETEAVA